MLGVRNRPQFRARERYAAEWRSQGFHRGLTLWEEIRRGLEAHPSTRIVIEGDGADLVTTTAALVAEAKSLAGSMAALGLKSGDVIVVQLPNGRENLLVYLAALRLGLIVVPVVTIYGARELGFILAQCGARALFVPDRWRNVDMAARLRALPALPALEWTIATGTQPLPGANFRWAELEALPAAAFPEPRQSPDDVCLINYTSGTTSAPKGVMHTHHTLAAETRHYAGLLEDPTDRSPYMGVTPAGHIGGTILALRPFLCGTEIIFVNAWEQERVIRLIRDHTVGQVAGVPLIFNALLDAPDRPASIRIGVTGGAGVPPALVERADAQGIRIVRSYGSTEHPTVSGGHADDSLRQRSMTDGRLTPGTLLRIVDEDGRELPRGEPGEIVSMGPELFVGYFDESLDEAAFTPDGWYRSGDVGVLDDDGLLAIVDRKKDIIIRGGENVSSQEVEAILARHPAVLEAVAVPWPDDTYGERVGVFVRLRPGTTLDIPGIQAHFAAQGAARQKTPERLVVVDDFERTAMGKVVKASLRRRIAELVAQAPRRGAGRTSG